MGPGAMIPIVRPGSLTSNTSKQIALQRTDLVAPKDDAYIFFILLNPFPEFL